MDWFVATGQNHCLKPHSVRCIRHSSSGRGYLVRVTRSRSVRAVRRSGAGTVSGGNLSSRYFHPSGARCRSELPVPTRQDRSVLGGAMIGWSETGRKHTNSWAHRRGVCLASIRCTASGSIPFLSGGRLGWCGGHSRTSSFRALHVQLHRLRSRNTDRSRCRSESAASILTPTLPDESSGLLLQSYTPWYIGASPCRACHLNLW